MLSADNTIIYPCDRPFRMPHAESPTGEDACTRLAMLWFLNVSVHVQETPLQNKQLVYLIKITSKSYITLLAHQLFEGKVEFLFIPVCLPLN